jgi:putative FmdB family regulatory protein
MPIYEYLCDDCGTAFEKLVMRASQKADVACPSCGEQHVSQQYSSFAAHANGSASSSVSCEADMPSCGSGMCSTPGFCSRN